MPEPDLLGLFVLPLQNAGIKYLVSGSMAAMLYGEPRLTHDVDLVVFLRADDIPRLPLIFPESDFYVPPAFVIASEMARERRGHFNVIHPQSGLKADLYLANRDELHGWAFRNSRSYVLAEQTVTLAPRSTSSSANSSSFARAARTNIFGISVRCWLYPGN